MNKSINTDTKKEKILKPTKKQRVPKLEKIEEQQEPKIEEPKPLLKKPRPQKKVQFKYEEDSSETDSDDEYMITKIKKNKTDIKTFNDKNIIENYIF